MDNKNEKGCCKCRNAHWEDLSMHGVRRLVRAKGSCGRRACWVIIILMSLSVTVYQTLGCVIYFLTYPTQMHYQITPPSPENSPAITLCNLNAWRLSLLDQKGWLLGLESLYSQGYQNHPKSGANISSTDAYTRAGHTLQDMVLRCTHGLRECNHSNFSMIFTEYGLCYTFPKLDQYQLDLILNVEEYEYYERANQRVGIAVIVHGSDDSPFLSTTHFIISPGMHTNVELQLLHVSSIAVSHTGCDTSLGNQQSGCRKDCLFQLIVDRCGCTPFWTLHQQASYVDVTVCSLHSHVMCVRKQVSELTMDSSISICHCEIPCQYTMYTPHSSASDLSGRDYHHYLTGAYQYKVANQLLHAENIRARIHGKDINQHIKAFTDSVDDFGRQVETTKRNSQQVQKNLNNLMSQMYKRTWFHYYVGLNGMEKIFRHGFLPQWKVVDLQFLIPLVSSCQMILYSYDNVVTKLDMSSTSETALRRTLYLAMEEQLTVRMELAIQGLDNFTKVYYSFLDMKPTSSYIVTPERRYDASLLPIEAIADVGGVLRSEYGVIANLLAQYMDEILTLKKILNDVYLSKSGLNKTAYQNIKELFLKTNLDLQTHLDTFRIKATQKIQEIVESQTDHFKKQNESMFSSWARLVSALDETADQLELVSLHHYPHAVDLSQDGQLYISNREKLLSDIATAGLSNAVVDSIDILVKRIGTLKARQEVVSNLWQKFTSHYLNAWSLMLENHSLKDFYSKLNADVTNIVQNPSSTKNLKSVFAHNKMLGKSSTEIRTLQPEEFYVLLNADFPLTSLHGKEVETLETIGQFSRLTDVNLQLQDLDIPLKQSYTNLQNMFRQFMQRSTLDEQFIKKNIGSISIKLAASGHETVTEISTYSLAQLLHDIGLTIVLFLGASIITIFEFLDILVTCLCCKCSSKKDDKSDDDEGQSTDSLSGNTRHVTFQFPTENHVGSPTKPALKRPRLEYYPGDIQVDRMTSLGETHTEIL